MTICLSLLALGFSLASFAVGVSSVGAWLAGMGLGMSVVLCVQSAQKRKPVANLARRFAKSP